MTPTIGIALIARNAGNTIKDCLESFIAHVDQCVVVLAGESTDKTEEIVRSIKGVEVHKFEWIDDFSAARNFSFSKLKTDFLMWVDADDVVQHPEKLKEIAGSLAPEFGAVWFPYNYAQDEFGNVTTLYERERLLRAECGWVWQGRLHETVSPLRECQYARTDTVVIKHNHLGGVPRGERNFRILNLMLKENPNDKRIWLYMGHQTFAAERWMDAAQWYMKFGTDQQALPLERYQALCYCTKAMRNMGDEQCIDTALMAIELFPEYRDAYLELAHSYLAFGKHDKAIHFAKLSEIKELIQAPPAVIFINPMEYTFNRLALLSECYLYKGELETALEYVKQAYEYRPVQEVENNIAYISGMIARQRAVDGIKVLAVELLNNKELVKLHALLEATPYWFREMPDYAQLKAGVGHYTQNVKNKPRIVEGENKSVTVDVANAYDLDELLEELDKKYDKVTLTCPMPSADVEQSNVLSQSDVENLIISGEGRHIINLRQEEKGITCEYDKKVPSGLAVRIFVGQGIEPWNPKKIQEQGEGGSETSAAWTGRAFARKGHQPFIYAMDNQIWDGVIYRHFSKYSPDSMPCDLFISVRVPDVFFEDIPARQKWLWLHDIHSGARLTPEVASRIDVLIALSHWHCEHLKRAYPFLKDCEEIDLDGNDKTFDDVWTPHTFHEGREAYKLPKMAIIGDGINIDRFFGKEKKVHNRFIWASSADRGLEELLNLWPKIKAGLPDAELKIYYGWNYLNSTLWIPAQREFKERLRKLIQQDGVEWCGRLGQRALAREQMKAEFLLYPPPHQFRETYGIAFLEAQAAGIICFYRKNGALGETVGNRGIPLDMDMQPDDIVKKVIEVAKNRKLCEKLRREGHKYAMGRDWKAQADKMLKLYGTIKDRGGAG